MSIGIGKYISLYFGKVGGLVGVTLKVFRFEFQFLVYKID